MTVLERNHAATASGQTDGGRYCESSDKHGILLLQCCNLVIVELEAFLQLFLDKRMSVLFFFFSVPVIRSSVQRLPNLL